MATRRTDFAERAARVFDDGDLPSFFEEMALQDKRFAARVSAAVKTTQGERLLSHYSSPVRVLRTAVNQRIAETIEWGKDLQRIAASRTTDIAIASAFPSERDEVLSEADSEQLIALGRFHRDFWAEVYKEPDLLLEISPEDFEEAMAHLLAPLGFRDIERTRRSGDHGLDILAVADVSGMPVRFGFECKRYSRHRPIRPALLRELLGSIHAQGIPNGVLLTTSFFSKYSLEFLELQAAVNGRNLDEIVEWVGEALRQGFGV